MTRTVIAISSVIAVRRADFVQARELSGWDEAVTPYNAYPLRETLPPLEPVPSERQRRRRVARLALTVAPLSYPANMCRLGVPGEVVDANWSLGDIGCERGLVGISMWRSWL